MYWIKVTPETMPPDMVPVAVKEYAFPWESEDDESAYLTCYNLLYDRGKGVWLAKDPSGNGEYVEHNGKNIKMWALM